MSIIKIAEKIIANIKCCLGVHTYDFKKYPMESNKILIDGYEAYLTTIRCANCGRTHREIEFVDDLCKSSIVEELRNAEIEEV